MALATSLVRVQTGTPVAQSPPVDQALTVEERRLVVDTFVGLLEGLYTHLPLKRAMYGFDPVQQLRLLGRRAADIDDHSFHNEMWRIITSLRDAHTIFIGPQNLTDRVARLPFLVEKFEEHGDRKYLVSKTADKLIEDNQFKAGVELTMWNGVPIDIAVERHADRETGGRPDARRARAVESLTIRGLQYGPPPDEHWVVVGYTTNGNAREVRLPWQVITPGASPDTPAPATPAARARSINPVGEQARRAKKLMFKGELWQKEASVHNRPASFGDPNKGNVAGRFGDNVSARTVQTKAGVFGYLRLWSFDLLDDDAYVAEVVDLVGLLPQNGLIIDLRSNPGGLIWAAERLLQLFTPHPIQPTRFSLLATEVTRAMVRAPQNQAWLSPWAFSLEQAVATGDLYSQALPITPPHRANDIGQVYGGPVVAVIDPNTYSAGDLFTAGFVDNQIGTLISVGEATGAGGANVWEPATVAAALAGTRYAQAQLPSGLGYRLAVRRATRIGYSEGAAIEDVGIPGDRQYAMTRDDLINDNCDLLEHCGKLLAAEPTTSLDIVSTAPNLTANTSGLTRLDIYLDDRPLGSLPANHGQVEMPLPTPWETITIEGFSGAALRQRRRIQG